MNLGLRFLLISLLLIGCASTPKPTGKKKATPAGAMAPKSGKAPLKGAPKGGVPAKPAPTKAAPAKVAPVAPPAPAEPAEEEPAEEEEEEEDDQFSRIKKYYKK